jgi:hypothetical protein
MGRSVRREKGVGHLLLLAAFLTAAPHSHGHAIIASGRDR